MENILIGSSPLKNRGIKHDVKMYTREEYLQWCRKNNVKNPLPEYKRNKMTECGYTTHPYDPFF